jgi:hypothetical protein
MLYYILDVRTRFVVCIFIHSKDNVVNFNVYNAKLMHMLNFLNTFSVGVTALLFREYGLSRSRNEATVLC